MSTQFGTTNGYTLWSVGGVIGETVGGLVCFVVCTAVVETGNHTGDVMRGQDQLNLISFFIFSHNINLCDCGIQLSCRGYTQSLHQVSIEV